MFARPAVRRTVYHQAAENTRLRVMIYTPCGVMRYQACGFFFGKQKKSSLKLIGKGCRSKMSTCGGGNLFRITAAIIIIGLSFV